MRAQRQAAKDALRALALTTVAITTGLLTTGCGGGSPTHRVGSTGVQRAAVAYATCMRSHGVANLPDPSQSPPSGSYSSYHGIVIPPSINVQSPGFVAANVSCEKLLYQGSATPPPITDSLKRALLSHAQCMREHGAPNYPDPSFPSGGGIEIGQLGGSGADPRSPSFQHAEKACGTGN